MAVFSGPEIVNDGLVVHLDAANLRSYPGSGTAFTDLSGNNRNFTLVGDAAYSSNNNGSIFFDGTNDRVDSNSPISVSTTTITASCWVKVAAHGNYHNFIGNNWTNNGWLLFSDVSGWYFGIAQSNQQSNASISHNNSTSWTHLTGTYDGSSVRLYVNGVLRSTTAKVGATLDVGFFIRIGADGTRPSAYNIANTLLYSRALTAAEVSQNFEATRGRFGI
jgi:hypothetical protein